MMNTLPFILTLFLEARESLELLLYHLSVAEEEPSISTTLLFVLTLSFIG